MPAHHWSCGRSVRAKATRNAPARATAFAVAAGSGVAGPAGDWLGRKSVAPWSTVPAALGGADPVAGVDAAVVPWALGLRLPLHEPTATATASTTPRPTPASRRPAERAECGDTDGSAGIFRSPPGGRRYRRWWTARPTPAAAGHSTAPPARPADSCSGW